VIWDLQLTGFLATRAASSMALMNSQPDSAEFAQRR